MLPIHRLIQVLVSMGIFWIFGPVERCKAVEPLLSKNEAFDGKILATRAMWGHIERITVAVQLEERNGELQSGRAMLKLITFFHLYQLWRIIFFCDSYDIIEIKLNYFTSKRSAIFARQSLPRKKNI